MTKTVQNLQVDKEFYLRVEEQTDGAVSITIVHHREEDGKFRHIGGIVVPKLQRENLANFLHLTEQQKT